MVKLESHTNQEAKWSSLSVQSHPHEQKNSSLNYHDVEWREIVWEIFLKLMGRLLRFIPPPSCNVSFKCFAISFGCNTPSSPVSTSLHCWQWQAPSPHWSGCHQGPNSKPQTLHMFGCPAVLQLPGPLSVPRGLHQAREG